MLGHEDSDFMSSNFAFTNDKRRKRAITKTKLTVNGESDTDCNLSTTTFGQRIKFQVLHQVLFDIGSVFAVSYSTKVGW